MADHAVFVAIGDGARLEVAHLAESALRRGFHPGKEVVREIHAGDIEQKPERLVAQEVALVALPESGW